ncbi:hypothetical protein AVEN_129365-1, partial [Araneus ventricosus]
KHQGRDSRGGREPAALHHPVQALLHRAQPPAPQLAHRTEEDTLGGAAAARQRVRGGRRRQEISPVLVAEWSAVLPELPLSRRHLHHPDLHGLHPHRSHQQHVHGHHHAAGRQRNGNCRLSSLREWLSFYNEVHFSLQVAII